jgi:hypothetical protein
VSGSDDRHGGPRRESGAGRGGPAGRGSGGGHAGGRGARRDHGDGPRHGKQERSYRGHSAGRGDQPRRSGKMHGEQGGFQRRGSGEGRDRWRDDQQSRDHRRGDKRDDRARNGRRDDWGRNDGGRPGARGDSRSRERGGENRSVGNPQRRGDNRSRDARDERFEWGGDRRGFQGGRRDDRQDWKRGNRSSEGRPPGRSEWDDRRDRDAKAGGGRDKRPVDGRRGPRDDDRGRRMDRPRGDQPRNDGRRDDRPRKNQFDRDRRGSRDRRGQGDKEKSRRPDARLDRESTDNPVETAPVESQEPELPEDVDASELPGEARRELRAIPKGLADKVALHLVAAGKLIDSEPERALEHARYARHRAARIGCAREANGLTAYQAGEWSEALGELRAARRMGGGPGHLALMADCERALGRPERALELSRGPEVAELDEQEAVELRIVAAGARRDLGEIDASVVSLQIPELDPERQESWSARLFYAYADNLLAAERVQEAFTWFVHAANADDEGETDAPERLDQLAVRLGGTDATDELVAATERAESTDDPEGGPHVAEAVDSPHPNNETGAAAQ